MDTLCNRLFYNRHERQPFRDPSLYTADSEDEDDRTKSKEEETVKSEEQNSLEADGSADAQKPLNSKLAVAIF